MSIALKKNFNLTINGQQRPVTGWKYMNGSGYSVQVPAKQLVDNSPFGENPSVQGHVAKFDNNGNLLGVTAQGWNAESGFYNTQWPSKQDSVYNANAAKQYAPQLFKAFQNQPTEYIKEEKCGGKVKKGENGIKTPTALSGRSYWDGFKARNEALWDKVKNNTFVNMLFPVQEVSEGNTQAILPLIVPGGNAAVRAANAVGKKAVGKTANKIKQTITPLFEGKPTEFVRSYDGRTLPVYRPMVAGSESSAGAANLQRIPTQAQRKYLGSDGDIEKEIEHAIRARGLREQMAKWDQELLTNADRNIIKPSLLDELTTLNTQYIKEIDPNLISGSTEPPLLGAIMLGSGVGVAGGGLYLVTKGKPKKENKPSQTTIEEKNKKQHGGRLMRQGGKIIEVPFEK